MLRYLKNLLLILAGLMSIQTFAQKKSKSKSKPEKIELSKESLFRELSESACGCVDTVEILDRKKEDWVASIHTCIQTSVSAYMVSLKFLDADLLSKAAEGENKKINIDINLNTDSKEFKTNYYLMESYMMDSCASLKTKMKTNDITSKQSFSDNEDAMEWYRKAGDEGEKQNHKLAVNYYNKALAIDPNFAFAWDNLGLSYRKLEKYDSALYAYKKSLQIDPRGITPLQNMAVVYIYKEDFEKAKNTYLHMTKLDPENPEIFYGLGQVYSAYLGNNEEGLRNMCKAYKLYIKQNSPYRSDAEKVIQGIYSLMKEEGKESSFHAILKENNINME